MSDDVSPPAVRPKTDRSAYFREYQAFRRKPGPKASPAVRAASLAEPGDDPLRLLSDREIVTRLNQKIGSSLKALTEDKISEMKGRDIAVTLGILIDKHQIMQGKPSVVFSFEERQKLPELTQMWMAEARKRGLTIDATAVEVLEEIRPKVFAREPEL